jgi:hypothetical protein
MKTSIKAHSNEIAALIVLRQLASSTIRLNTMQQGHVKACLILLIKFEVRAREEKYIFSPSNLQVSNTWIRLKNCRCAFQIETLKCERQVNHFPVKKATQPCFRRMLIASSFSDM